MIGNLIGIIILIIILIIIFVVIIIVFLGIVLFPSGSGTYNLALFVDIESEIVGKIFPSVKHSLHGFDGNLYHLIVGLLGGKVLEPYAGCSEHVNEYILALSRKCKDLV